MSAEVTAWALGGTALLVVGLSITVAVLGIQLGRARAGATATAATLHSALDREEARTEERDRALAELANERARAAQQSADLEQDLHACEQAAAESLPPEVLRERFRDLLARWGSAT